MLIWLSVVGRYSAMLEVSWEGYRTKIGMGTSPVDEVWEGFTEYVSAFKELCAPDCKGISIESFAKQVAGENTRKAHGYTRFSPPGVASAWTQIQTRSVRARLSG